MAKKKISTILGLSKAPEMRVEKLLDNLAQRIFLPEMDSKKMLEYYVPREDVLNERFGQESHMKYMTDLGETPDVAGRIGLYEKLLWNKLVYPPRNVLVLLGGVGCGKTTSVKLITGITKDNPIHCEDLERCRKNKSCLCNGIRLHVIMDFNQIIYKNVSGFDDALREFVNDLSDRMSSNLYSTVDITDKLEFLRFWNYEIKRQKREGGLRDAFSKIENLMHQEVGSGWEKLDKNKDIGIRKEIFKKIRDDPFLFLDYLCRFWHYVFKKIYHGQRQCVFVIIDNIDCASPALQTAVREVVTSYEERFGNTFMVCLRPETLLAKPGGVAAKVIDIEPHCGPEPYDIVVHRLKRFLDNPKPYFRSGELSKELENHMLKLSGMLYEQLTKKGRETMKKFIEALAGSNIRCALLMATNLLKVEIGEYNMGIHELNRVLISPPYKHYLRKSNSPTENIFHVEDAPEGRLLIKGRILRLLRLGQRNMRSISELITMLRAFGYEPELICKACNEMMEPAHQLIISNGKSEYSVEDFLTSENDNIFLTYAGMGYADKLISDLDYISMVMPDCVIETSGLPSSIRYEMLLQRLKVVLSFVRVLNKVDYDETSYLKMKYNRRLYIEHYGNTMLTWEIINSVCRSISRILYSLENQKGSIYLRDPMLRVEMEELYKDIENILNIAARNNRIILNRKVEYVVPRPLHSL